MSLKVGSDIEYFITSADSMHSKALLPGEIACPEDKRHPRKYQFGRMHWDNIAIEICPDAADNETDFIHNINQMREQLLLNVRGVGAQVVGYSSAYINKDLVRTPSAAKFGCDPDLNAYTRKLQRINAKVAQNLRTCGGHVHIGKDELSMPDKILLVKILDMYLGVPSVMLDQDTNRREVYGKAGSFRPKDYGLEYRVLSNFWSFSDNLMGWVFNQVEEAVELFDNMKEEKEDWFTPHIEEELRGIINQGDRRKARAWVKSSNVAMP